MSILKWINVVNLHNEIEITRIFISVKWHEWIKWNLTFRKWNKALKKFSISFNHIQFVNQVFLRTKNIEKSQFLQKDFKKHISSKYRSTHIYDILMSQAWELLFSCILCSNFWSWAVPGETFLSQVAYLLSS